MITVENIIMAYDSMKQADNWAQWAKDNPAASSLLNMAIKAAADNE